MNNTVHHVRKAFLEFFQRHDHAVLPSSPLVPHNDPTLMFTNAGMNQFKNIFTGAEKTEMKCAATAQKCVRAGGKHNDLDNVGYTARHHTFFEMLGNFSFGDYFKERAIVLAWELLTKEFAIAPEKLSFTVYHTDDEAFGLWKKIAGCADERILRVPTKDNFWAMGDTGPCGPCSEIFYDHGKAAGEGEWALNADGSDRFGERFVEIWNLVFMQFDQRDDGERVALPTPSIDTGMGLERIAAVLQGVHDNYDTDLFRALIGASQAESRVVTPESRVSHRVIADHLRASSFLIADGVMPSNEGRGYVLRRIMRRAMRHAHQLGCREPLMYRLVPTLAGMMGEAYPELRRAEAVIEESLRGEEERFKAMLDRGLKLLEEASGPLARGGVLPGEVAFKLYDTYGFPLDLTEDILRGKGIGVDAEGFEASMAEQRDRARQAWSGSGEKAVGQQWFALKERLGATAFTGYEEEASDAEVLAVVPDGDEAYVVLDRTPFYGESGGQVGDTGRFAVNGQAVAEVLDTQKPLEDFHVHRVRLLRQLAAGDRLRAEIDADRRAAIRANHSATHLLHKALRDRLGAHVTQKGSLVAPDRLRFDFSHGKALAPEDIAAVEAQVNALIWRNTPVQTRCMAPEAAINAGAMALFGEKYGEQVRVLSMGAAGDQWQVTSEESRHSPPGTHYSIELCGGTHVRATGDIGLFKIIGESAVAAGVRRIEAVTRKEAFAYLETRDEVVRQLAEALKTPAESLPERIAKLQEEQKKLARELAAAKKQLALGGSAAAAPQAEKIGEHNVAVRLFDDLAPKELRGVAEDLLKSSGADVAVAATGFEGKASLVAAVAKGRADALSAVTLVQAAVAALGGKGGGGRPEMAQGGGPDAALLGQAVEAIRAALRT
ncbi:MAG: alanine--tRNA ligase [Alphaproteobacteria bacterium]|nr:alanine--tRNA ligase [Alphaproteobacteria bacterium]